MKKPGRKVNLNFTRTLLFKHIYECSNDAKVIAIDVLEKNIFEILTGWGKDDPLVPPFVAASNQIFLLPIRPFCLSFGKCKV